MVYVHTVNRNTCSEFEDQNRLQCNVYTHVIICVGGVILLTTCHTCCRFTLSLQVAILVKFVLCRQLKTIVEKVTNIPPQTKL